VDDNDFQTQLIHKIEEFSGARLEGFTAEDKFFSTGLVDSMTIVEIITFVEEYWNIRVDPTDLSVDNFDSINAMTAFVRRKRANA
jgi:acyl carrier protein